MTGGSIALPMRPPHSPVNRGEIKDAIEDDDDMTLENEGLLSGSSSRPIIPLSSPSKHRRKSGTFRKASSPSSTRRSWLWAGLFITTSFIVFLVIPASLPQTSHHYTGMPVGSDVRLSNGTHQYRKTVLMISIDGMRADYVDRGLTPHLLDISQQGLRAKFMKPIFPSLTFPNHWSLLTGLYAESHGIVANNFYDPVSNSSFHYADPKAHTNSSWWGGAPIWETASKAGLITANLMFPGPVRTQNGISSTYFVPWRNNVPLHEKHDQIMEWIDLPFDERPQLILAYEPHLDQVGHLAGPGSKLVNDMLLEVDDFAASIHSSLRSRNLTNIVDVIFVSDHGMTNTSNSRLVYLEDILGHKHYSEIEHEDGWPSVGLRFSPTTNTTDVLSRLLSSPEASSSPPAIHVYTEKTMPARYHFNPRQNERIAPIYVVPNIGWAITNHHEHEDIMQGNYEPKGNHGYDNDEPSMYATFIADGPFATLLKRRQVERACGNKGRIGRLRCGIRSILGSSTSSLLSARAGGSAQVIEGFPNVEIYNLIVKLLGIDLKFAASNNGTTGFWDRYLDED